MPKISKRKQELGTKTIADKHELHYILSVPVSALYELSLFESNLCNDKGLSTHEMYRMLRGRHEQFLLSLHFNVKYSCFI